MKKHPCGWSSCSNDAEATLDCTPLCRGHFYSIASTRLEEYQARSCDKVTVDADRTKILNFISEVISETTTLVASAKSLGQEQREKYVELSLLTAKLYKRVQKHPRIPLRIPIFISHETDSPGRQELTNTIDVSIQGACIATKGKWKTEEKIRVQKPQSQLRAYARVTWVKTTETAQTFIGIEILNCEDFWNFELAGHKEKPSR